VRILLLSARPSTASNRRLVEAASRAGHRIDLVDAAEACVDSDGGLTAFSGSLLEDLPPVVWARVGNWRPDSMLAVLESLTLRGVVTPNPAPAIRIGRDHWRTAQTLAAAGLPVPTTVAGSDPEALAAAVVERMQFPVVVKQRRSRMGVGVIRCLALDQLEAVLDSLWRVGDEVVVQRHVETGGSSDRLLVVGGEVVAAARFTATGDEWRSNAARGGVGTKLAVEPGALSLAVRAAEAVGLGICGVDLLPGDDGVVIGELNPTPGFSGLEAATGVDVASAIVRGLVGFAS
jgi:RimK family alpha-L-glutamate ligase